MRRWLVTVALMLVTVLSTAPHPAAADTAPPILRVVLIPADGGTEDGTKADYR